MEVSSLMAVVGDDEREVNAGVYSRGELLE